MESHRIHLAVSPLWHYCGVIFLWLALAVFLGILWRFNPEESSIYPTCRFLEHSGYKCGGCGILRSTHALLHGEWLLAARYHVLWVAALPLSILCLLWHTVAVVRGKPWQVMEFFWAHPSILLAVGVLAVLFLFLRNFFGF
jgi:hypothetical protein